jgi:phosphohistidine phosphatase
MDLYVIRHAEAVSRDDPTYGDDERPLTENGRTQARTLARSLVARGIQFDAVIASPLARARQTAEEMLQNMPGPLADVEFCRHVAPGGKHRKLIRFLLGVGGESVALVGHEPVLGEFAARLIGCRKANVKLAKAGVAHIRYDGSIGKDDGTLIWLLTPEWIFEAPDVATPVMAAW